MILLSAKETLKQLTPGEKAARVFFLAILLYIVFSLLVYGFFPRLQNWAFFMLGETRMMPSFADLRWVTSLSECSINLDELAKGHLAGCDPWARGGLNYPPLSVEAARFLHVQGVHTGLLGFAFGIATISILLGLLNQLLPDGWIKDLSAGLVLISFPLQLALERCNIDIIVFLLLTSIAALAASLRVIALPFTALAAWLAVAIKLYPFVGILAWLVLGLFSKPPFDLWRASCLFGGVLGFAASLPWFLKYGESAPQPLAGLISHSFVVPIPGNHANKILQYTQSFPIVTESFLNKLSIALSLAIFFAVLLTCFRQRIPFLWAACLDHCPTGYVRRFLSAFPNLLGCTWLSCYFFSGSFDYRMILLVPVFICMLSLLAHSSRDTQGLSVNTACLTAASGFICVLLPLLLPIASRLSIPLVSSTTNALIFMSDLLLMPIIAAGATSIIFKPPQVRCFQS